MQAPREAEVSPSLEATLDAWAKVQEELKGKVVTDDDVPWSVEGGSDLNKVVLRYVGGVDVSFSKEDLSLACGCLVVLELPSLRVVHHDMAIVRLDVPYFPGFLAFREAPVLLQLLDNMKRNQSPFYPQVVMVDGNGLLHPRGFGLACHLGVIADVPTVGVGKNLHHVDGLTQARVRELLESDENKEKSVINLRGDSGSVWGAGMRLSTKSLKPIFISVGHRLSLHTATKIVKLTCKYRLPEPIRQADVMSRAHLHKSQQSMISKTGPDESVIICIKHILVDPPSIIYRRCSSTVEERKINGEVGIIVETDEGVDVNSERSSIVVKKLHKLKHKVPDIWTKISFRRDIRRALVHIGIKGYSNFDLWSKTSFYYG